MLVLTGSMLEMGNYTLWAQAAAPAPAPPATAVATNPPPKWEKSAALGFTLTEGNSDTVLLTADVLAVKKWMKNEFGLGASATYGENDGDKNNETVRGFAQYNRLITERLFAYGRLDALHDAIADVEYRISVSPGMGYYFVKNDRTTLSGEVGPGFVYEKQGRDETGYMTARFAERFTQKIGEKSRLWQSLEFLPQVDDFENYLINAEIGLSTDITKDIGLRVTLQDTYDNEPAPDRDENDLKFITALTIRF